MLEIEIKALCNVLPNKEKSLCAALPSGGDALFLSELCQTSAKPVLFVARDDVRMSLIADSVKFFAPEIEVLAFPAWDTVPYDRVSPKPEIVAERLDVLAALARPQLVRKNAKQVVITTINALLQKLPKPEFFVNAVLEVVAGKPLLLNNLLSFLEANSYHRVEQVMEVGEYAVRGGIVDVFPPGSEEPLRLDFFGDEVDSIRRFDAMSQRTTGKEERFVFKPMSEVFLTENSINRFRQNYRAMFGAASDKDEVYTAISAGKRVSGMEHWLPLFYEGMSSFLDYLKNPAVILDFNWHEAVEARYEQILEYFNARQEVAEAKPLAGSVPYHPIPPSALWLEKEEVSALLSKNTILELNPFGVPDIAPEGYAVIDFKGKPLAPLPHSEGMGEELFGALRRMIVAERGKKVVVSAFSDGSCERLSAMLREYGVMKPQKFASFAEALSAKGEVLPLVVSPLERGFRFEELVVITENDIFGERIGRPAKRKKKSEEFIGDVSSLTEGDLVVHEEHGIGRFVGLVTITAGGAPHDCLSLIYAGGDKLFVPVENLEVLSRYGSESEGVQLDRLGGVAWQSRKAKVKERLKEMADQLIALAAKRLTRPAESYLPPEKLYDEFSARFPYVETEDQLKAINDVISDLGAGRPMDRLVCGDVGFGKTEVALRAAFVAAMNGSQVALVVPTTLLARQHYKNFCERFKGVPLRIAQLSRLVSAKHASQTKKEMEEGKVDVVIGTHALLANNIKFKNLGLLIIDEEQHFGVAHKEKLKQFKADIHVLTLTATPIPRTLQMSLAGVRELSLIGTPPVDRLAVRTFVMPFDAVVIREALLRERYRGGQSFYVCPRIANMDEIVEKLEVLVPELKLAVAHGRMSPTQIEEVMNAFAEGEYDVLLSTSIIESGIDLPSVNTMIVHRADMFGLSQLYQLRGRIGRGKTRAYAYLTVPEGRILTKTAEKRLSVMQALDTLGAGFSLASYDMDIRGPGNLLGDEQSGHIKEVGVALYQHLLEEAVAAARAGGSDDATKGEDFSPQINTGIPVMIPEDYIRDLGVRLALYRRIADLASEADSEALAAEMIDRFGKLPDAVENLLETVALKRLCKTANIERIEVGDKGAVISLRNNIFPNPEGLVAFITRQAGTVKLRPDNKIVFIRNFGEDIERIKALKSLVGKMADIALKA